MPTTEKTSVKEVKSNVGNRYQVVDSLPLTDRQPNRKDKSKLRTILKNIHQPSTRVMARLISNSRVCI